MAGDLSKWSPADIAPAEGDSVKFKRKGGWFVTKKLLITGIIAIIVLLLAAILITKRLTENQYKPADVEPATNDSHNSPVIRLSEDIIPKHYDLKLKPYLDIAPLDGQPFSVSGQVIIQFIVNKPTSMFTVHYQGISINYTGVYNNFNKSLTVKSDKFEKSLDLYSVEVEESFVPEFNYSVHLIFHNIIDDEENGFYRIKYTDKGSPKQRWMGVSQLEPIYARRLFPCFDEPRFRTTIDISIHRLKNMSALANSNKKVSLADEKNVAWIWDNFETTPAIPTHKISIIVADLTVSKVYINNITLSLWTRSDLFNSSLNIIEVTASLLKYYSSYITTVQPIKKLDLVAVPHFINDISGAWGLILYSESLLFENNNMKEELIYGLEISKKLGEQWLGNIVSVDWWTDLWINNGLTTYLGYLALHQVRPNSEMMSSFIVDVLQQSLDYESYPSSFDEILVSNDISEIWSSPYSTLKGASLFYMIASLSSTNRLKDAINNYLEKGAGKAVASNRLWESFSINSEKQDVDIIHFVENWLKSGYPVVNCQYDKQTGEIMINQKPFYLQHPPTDNIVWDISVKYTTAQKQLTKEHPTRIWLKIGDTTIKFVTHLNDSWVLVNLPPQGFYRANYDMENWKSLEKDLLNETVSLEDNVLSLLLDDSYQLAKAGRLSYSVPFNFTIKAASRSSLLPFKTIDRHLKFLQPFFYGESNNETVFKKFIWKLFLPHLQNTNASEGSDLSSSYSKNLSQAIALKWLCQYDHPVCVTLANSTFQNWINNKNISIDSTLGEIFFCTAIRLGRRQDFEILLNTSLLTKGIKANKRLQLLKSLTCTSNSSFILELLQKTVQLDKSLKEMNDFNDEVVAAIWHSLHENLAITGEVLDFLLKHWNEIYRKYQSNNKVMDAIIKGATESLIEQNQLTDLASLKDHIIQENKMSMKSLELAVNKLIVKTAWRNTKYLQVVDILEHLLAEP